MAFHCARVFKCFIGRGMSHFSVAALVGQFADRFFLHDTSSCHNDNNGRTTLFTLSSPLCRPLFVLCSTIMRAGPPIGYVLCLTFRTRDGRRWGEESNGVSLFRMAPLFSCFYFYPLPPKDPANSLA